MPTYDFINSETGEVFEKVMKIADREEYLKENPTIKPHFGQAPSIGDPIRLGVKKVDTGFKEVLQKIHARSPGSQLDKTTRI
jgi:hypothetical protein